MSMKRKRILFGSIAIAVLGFLIAIPVGCMGIFSGENKEMEAFPLYASVANPTIGSVLSYRQTGNPEGQRVIFIHGSPGDAGAWVSYLKTPVGDLNVVAVDRLGYGNSISKVDKKGKPQKTAVVSFHEQAQAIAPLLVEQNGKWPIIVGHSLGGPIAAQLAAEHPDKVGGLLILAGSLDPLYEDPRWYTNLFSSGLTRWILPGPLKQSNREMLSTLQETKALGLILHQITCPVIVLHGEDDSLVPVGNVDYMRQNFINAESPEYIIIPKQGHFLPWEQEPMVRDLVIKLSQ